MKTVYDLFLS